MLEKQIRKKSSTDVVFSAVTTSIELMLNKTYLILQCVQIRTTYTNDFVLYDLSFVVHLYIYLV